PIYVNGSKGIDLRHKIKKDKPTGQFMGAYTYESQSDDETYTDASAVLGNNNMRDQPGMTSQSQQQPSTAEEVVVQQSQMLQQQAGQINQLQAQLSQLILTSTHGSTRSVPRFPEGIPKFDGCSDVDVHRFIFSVENQFSLRNWPDDKKVMGFYELLQDAAEQWAIDLFKENPEAMKWENFKALFIEKYNDPQRQLRMRRELASIGINPGESVAHYLHRFLSLAAKVDLKTDYDKKVILADSLPLKFSARVQAIFNTDDDLATFVDKVRVIDRDLTSWRPASQPAPRGAVGGSYARTNQRYPRSGGYQPRSGTYGTPAATNPARTGTALTDDSAMDLDAAELEEALEFAAVETRKLLEGPRCYG
ncbi:hypothetical protein BGX31_004660, partial [Mortierella sp. GBA43]